MQQDLNQMTSVSAKPPKSRTCAFFAVVAAIIVLLLCCGVSFGLYVAGLEQGAQLHEALSLRALVDGSNDATQTAAKNAGWPVPEPRQLYPHITLAPGGTIPSTAHSFYFNGKQHTVAPEVDPAVYWGAVYAPQEMTEYQGESAEEFGRAWEIAVICDPEQLPAVESLVAQQRAIRDAESLDSDAYLELIAKYVQSMPYDNARARNHTAPNMFPVQLMVDRKGICEEKTRLITLLLMHEGYAVADLQFERENHAAVGVRGPGQTYGESEWLFLESTGPAYVSEVPDEFVGGMSLTSEPWVVQIGYGAKKYGAADDVAYILKSRADAEMAAQDLVRTMESRRWSDSEWQSMENQLDIANQCYDYLWADAAAGNAEVDSKLKDREPALLWLQQNAWW